MNVRAKDLKPPEGEKKPPTGDSCAADRNFTISGIFKKRDKSSVDPVADGRGSTSRGAC